MPKPPSVKKAPGKPRGKKKTAEELPLIDVPRSEGAPESATLIAEPAAAATQKPAGTNGIMESDLPADYAPSAPIAAPEKRGIPAETRAQNGHHDSASSSTVEPDESFTPTGQASTASVFRPVAMRTR